MEKGGRKIWLNFIILSILVIMFSFMINATTRMCYTCNNCTAEIGNSSSGDIIQLNNSISVSGNCILFAGKSDVTFNCENYTNSISGASGTGTGISVSSPGSENVMIANCNITGFQYGIYLNTVNSSEIVNNTLFVNASSGYLYGLYLLKALSINITNITIFGNRTSAAPSTFYISQFDNGLWNLKYKYHFSNRYENKNFSFQKDKGYVRLRIMQNGSDFSDIEQISLKACGQKINPVYIRDINNNENLLNVLTYPDKNVAVMEGRIIEISWKIPFYCKEPATVSITANEYSNILRSFRAPDGTDFLNYSLTNKNKFMKIDGKINEVDGFQNPLYQFFWKPDTGHPDGYTYVYVNEDKDNIYFSLDITPDNTDENGEDWAKIILKINDEEKEFKIDDSHDKWGKCAFGKTSKVSYNHQTCEFKIPKNNLENEKEMDFAIEYYGTAAPSAYGIYSTLSNNTRLINATMGYFEMATGLPYGIYISSSDSPFLSGIISFDNSYSQLYLERVFNGIFKNIVASNGSSSSSSGIFLKTSSNNNFSNIIAMKNSRGIDVWSNSDNNSFFNITANNNTLYGIAVGDSFNSPGYNNSFNKIVTNYNLVDGIYVGKGVNDSFNDINSNNNSFYGLYIYLTNYSTFANITTDNNSWDGVRIQTSSLNNFINISSKNNVLSGIVLQEGASNNTIRNSFFQVNTVSAIILNSTLINSRFNLFYNNYFNNSVPYMNISTPPLNYFNVTKIAGANIVGGTYLAGNYWAAPNGTGFSQTCTSSTDGICDTAYSLDGVNYDYLPLTCIESWGCGNWGSCSSGTQTRTCTDANYCQTYKYRPALTQSCSETGTFIGSPTTQTETIPSIPSSQPTEITITNPDISLTNLIISTTETVSEDSVTVSEVKILPSAVEVAGSGGGGFSSGKAYKSFSVNFKKLNNSFITNATMAFTVNKTWLEEQNGTSDNIRLFRQNSLTKMWEILPTFFTREDVLFYYFNALTPGFSTFVVFFSNYECIPNTKRCFERDVQLCMGNSTWLITDRCQYNCKDGKCTATSVSSVFLYSIVVAVVSAGIIIVLYIIMRKVREERGKKRKL